MTLPTPSWHHSLLADKHALITGGSRGLGRTLWRQGVALLLAIIGVPLLGIGLVIKPAWRRGLAGRLGAVPNQPAGAIWLHAASAGEATILARVAERLDAAGHVLYASFTSQNGSVPSCGSAR